MLSRCPAELECDLAEGYGFFGELHELTPRKAAVLACGLRPDSRTARALENKYFGIDDGTLLVMERLGEIAYYTARGAGFRARRPKAPDITIKRQEKQLKGFGSVEEYEAEIKRIRGSA